MKKIPILLLFVFSFSMLRSQVQVGFKAGYNLSYFNYSYTADVTYNPRSNFNAGIIVGFPLGTHVSLQTESVYSGEGADISVFNVNGVYNLQMLNFPVMVKYLSPTHFFVETGPQIGFLLGATLTESGFPSSNIKSQTKNTNYSWAFGVGYQLPMNLGLDIRYNLGLTDIANTYSNSYNGASIKTNVFQVGIYYLFGNLFPAEKY